MDTVNKIGKYDIIRVLGAGGMGTVYQCIDPDLQRFVAIKVLNPPRKPSSISALKRRFLREALTTAQLQHPSIPPVYEVGQTQGHQFYYVMKPIEGQPLAAIIDKLKINDPETKEKFDLYRLIGVLKDICRCIDYAHTKGHIHRDLKPSNIFVGNFGEVYVIDWGLTKIVRDTVKEESANKLKKLTRNLDFDVKSSIDSINYELPVDYEKAIEIDELTHTLQIDTDDTAKTEELKSSQLNTLNSEENSNSRFTSTRIMDTMPGETGTDTSKTLTMQGKILGTLSYMSPEQALGDNANLGKESDIYSLGVILYEILTLEVPIEEKNLKKALQKKMAGQIESPEQRAIKREIPPELSAIAMQAMNPHPSGRFKTVKDFANALDFWIEGKPFYKTFNIRFNGPDSVLLLPEKTERNWLLLRDSLTTIQPPDDCAASYLLFDHEFIGNIILMRNSHRFLSVKTKMKSAKYLS